MQWLFSSCAQVAVTQETGNRDASDSGEISVPALGHRRQDRRQHVWQSRCALLPSTCVGPYVEARGPCNRRWHLSNNLVEDDLIVAEERSFLETDAPLPRVIDLATERYQQQRRQREDRCHRHTHHSHHAMAKDICEQGEVRQQTCLQNMMEVETCIICFDRPQSVKMEPCGHAQFCGRCARKLGRCPLCRMEVSHRRRIRC
uniref:RING-type domain-containing protein n=1 Tax=Noctiluca scintillans TaxID=2966 RepID=A0A7S1AUV6_NOCSC|mmetsp:Transcript_60079/g.159802  ORF Transcript_60079/g.159802 Transcript_60079/m.159802 type:complete len:202 (+) Transcript_60079:243-848(+)